MVYTTEEKCQRAIEATRRWRERNPNKVKEANRKPRHRIYDPVKNKQMRLRRLAVPGYRERINKQANDRANVIRRWLDEYKINVGCIDCGFKSHPAALHFDHINGDKSFNVCNAKSIKQAQKEIKKCAVRCANCHAIKTWKNHLESPPSTIS